MDVYGASVIGAIAVERKQAIAVYGPSVDERARYKAAPVDDRSVVCNGFCPNLDALADDQRVALVDY